ncbi:polyketide cyclase [Acrocarpospora phusangensis]|uniref:Polyketide cyclase n=1 Tax=Acrocarpospora phusangensis TaxID=1070424 RepID=A0A919ULY5_9ACTN|nr:SRPBCC family protein [Acrocarpospora phusangensis]GIH26746.1 polyketide cyclase [Acrocarpospora phusangensis]
MTVRLLVGEDVAAEPSRVFAVLTDWPRHQEWMLLTRAEVTGGDGRSAGSRLSAFTGVGVLGFLDTMEITGWDPPRSVSVRHTGRLVRGTGEFRVLPRPGGCRVEWEELLEVPAEALWPLARPVAALFFGVSLRRLGALARGREG